MEKEVFDIVDSNQVGDSVNILVGRFVLATKDT